MPETDGTSFPRGRSDLRYRTKSTARRNRRSCPPGPALASSISQNRNRPVYGVSAFDLEGMMDVMRTYADGSFLSLWS